MEERSAGAVLFHTGKSGRRYLLLKYPGGHWDFPKGNIEKAEKETETVVREVREETGITRVEIIPEFRREIEYFYRWGKRLVHKSVVFLLMRSAVEEVHLSFEHQDYGWFELEPALVRVTYSNSKSVLREADNHLAGLAE